MGTILLTKGRETQVDDHNVGWLSEWNWYTLKTGTNGKWPYASRHVQGGRYILRMHREIMRKMLGRDLTRKEQLDHVNGDTLDNRERNLRTVTRLQQSRNRKKTNGCSSRYKGVTYMPFHHPSGNPKARPWKGQIVVNYKHIHLGYHTTEEEAAEAYNTAADHHFGEYAKLNIID